MLCMGLLRRLNQLKDFHDVTAGKEGGEGGRGPPKSYFLFTRINSNMTTDTRFLSYASVMIWVGRFHNFYRLRRPSGGVEV